MSIFDTGLEAFRGVIEGEITRLKDLLAAAQRATSTAEAGLAAEVAAHNATRLTLEARNTLVKELEIKIDRLEARLEELEAEEPEQTAYRPVRFANMEEAIAAFKQHIPAGYKVVPWRWSDDVMLEQAFMEMGPNEILWLPERDKPYQADTSLGFRALGVTHLINGTQEIKIENTYRGKPARTWFALARSRAGIIGQGPGVVIEPSVSSFRQGPQAPQFQLKYRTTSGKINSLSEAGMRMMETESPNGLYANFTLKSRDLGGVAYSLIGAENGARFFNIHNPNGSRGFLNAPNGETGAFIVTRGAVVIGNCELSARDPETGKRVGTTPIMINRATDIQIDDVYVHDTYAGAAMSIYESSGEARLNRFRTEFASGINLEANAAGFRFVWKDGTDYIDYLRRGEWPQVPDANYKGNRSLHLNVRSPYGSQIININGVTIDKGPDPGFFSVQMYYGDGEVAKQRVQDITVVDKDGKVIPVKAYGQVAAGA